MLHMFGQRWSGKECVFIVRWRKEALFSSTILHSPSQSQDPSSSGAALPPSPQSAESTRGQQRAKREPANFCLWTSSSSFYSVLSILTFSASDKTVLAWMMATCSSFLKFYRRCKNKQTLYYNSAFFKKKKVICIAWGVKIHYPIISQDI